MMDGKIFALLLMGTIILICSCGKQRRDGSLDIHFNRADTCFALIDGDNKRISAFRELEIVQNSLTDTVVLGFSILPPRYIGKINYSREGNTMLDIENSNSRTDSLFFNSYKGRIVHGEIKIKFFFD